MDERGRRHDLTLSLALGLAFLGTCLWWNLRELMYSLLANKVTASVMRGEMLGPVLAKRLALFAAALLALHLLFGLLTFAGARLTAAAAPSFAGRERGLVIAWFLVLAGIVILANASYFPASHFSSPGDWLHTPVLKLLPADFVLGAFLLLVAGLVVLAIRRRALPLRQVAAWSAPLVIVAVALPLGNLLAGVSRATTATGMPNLVILGLDSLRDDFVDAQDGPHTTPHIDRFLAGAQRFTDATSPLARTYPALVSLLTGRHPVATNARFNLMPRRLVHEGETIGDALRAHGYRSIYATDEVRFANFDESFGFDQLIVPPVGASDFLLGRLGDLPLVNLVSDTRLGGFLFPTSHANRAAAVTYRPHQFVNRLERELDVSGPTFLFTHVTLAHWPYSWAEDDQPTQPQQYRIAYRRAVAEVDRQFAAIWNVIERKGLLDNAIVVVFSDHGEAIGFADDSMLRKTGKPMEVWNSLWGHGTSVVSAHQYDILLAIRAFGRARLPGRPARHDWPVAIEDLRPTLQELVTGKAPAGVDGVSLVPYLRDPAAARALEARVRFTETDFNTPLTLAGKYNESGLLDEAGMYYEIVPESGWIQLRADRLPELMQKKQRAAISRDALLASIPSWTDNSISYLFTRRHDPSPRTLQGRPDAAGDPEAARLWDALHARFAGELAGSPGLP